MLYDRSQRWILLVLLLVGGLLFGGLRRWRPEALSDKMITAGVAIWRAEATVARRSFRPAPESFRFDPNTVTAADLQRLGLSERQAKGWLKFRGDRDRAFRRPEDIARLYVLSDDEKARLITLAYVPEGSRGVQYTARSQVQGFAYDPNVVSPAELERLGLSPKQALAFVRYRDAARYGRAFKRVEDIARVRTMSDQQRAHLLKWARISEEIKATPPPAQRFPFDPNTISVDSLQLLGFPAWQARAFGKYRGERRYSFRRATDLRRVKALDSALVETVLSLVDISPPSPTASSAASAPAAAPITYGSVSLPAPQSFDANNSDTTRWKRLPGIGGYRARLIVSYQRKLGGFTSLAQIGETRNLPDSVLQNIIPLLKLERPVRQIPINYASVQELKRHPYIERKLANLIVKNRERNGAFRGPEDLARLRLLTAENRTRLTPYFSFE